MKNSYSTTISHRLQLKPPIFAPMAAISLHELNEFIRRFVALNVPEPVWVKAEIAEADERRGHYYLNLIEKAAEEDQIVAQSQAILWSSQARSWQRTHRQIRLADLLRAGQAVQLQVRVDFHERFGLKLVIEDIDPDYTLGQLAQRRQATIHYLESRGLIKLNQQLSLPIVPQRLAIISSPAAAGLQDFQAQLAQNAYGYQFQMRLFPAAMQGTQTSPEIRRQIRTLNRRKDDYDAIVMIRGGGARTDLADFDEQDLCEAAALAQLPILAGIGHETDQSVLDVVAHTSLKTPTAVANFLIDRALHFEQNLLGAAQELEYLNRQKLQQEERQLEQITQQMHYRTQKLFQAHEWQLQQAEQRLKTSSRQLLQKHRYQLNHLNQQHELLGIDTALRRGFAWLEKDGKAIKSIRDLQAKDQIIAHLQDGQAELEVKRNKPKK